MELAQLRSCSSPSSQSPMMDMEAPNLVASPSDTGHSLATLPCDVLQGRILSQLRPQEILSLSCCCKSIKPLCIDEWGVWKRLCEEHFGNSTSVSSWLQQSAPGHSPQLYRELYPVLMNHSSYVGIWHESSSSSKQGALYSFRWAADGVQVVQLVPKHKYLTELAHKQLCVLGPAYPRYSAVVLDDKHCILHDHGSSSHAAAPPCAVAEAAASVAVGGPVGRRRSSSDCSSSSSSSSSGGSSSNQDVPAGSSPGFCYELLRFMSSSVQKTRGSRRNRRAGSETPPVIHHFRRVSTPTRSPTPSSRHPHRLAGLYKGLYGPHGCEMLTVSYDFSGSAAQIVATKLTGDPNVPAGEVTWKAAAAPLPLPWPQQEQQLVALRGQMVAVTAESAAHMAEVEAEEEAAGNIIAALMQQEEPAAALQQQLNNGGWAEELAEQQGGAADDAGMLQGGIAGYAMQQAQAHVARINAWAAAMQARRVVAVHAGQGQIASRGFKNPGWVDGRLWVYEDGSCGFVFMLQPHVYHLIDLERLDADL